VGDAEVLLTRDGAIHHRAENPWGDDNYEMIQVTHDATKQYDEHLARHLMSIPQNALRPASPRIHVLEQPKQYNITSGKER